MRVLQHTLIFAAITGAPVLANTLYVDFGTMSREADLVALVKMEAGEVIFGLDGRTCGVAYRASVKRAVKGTTVDSLITFGPFSGRMIGKQYFVFLVSAATTIESTYRGVTDSSQSELLQQYKLNCESRLPALREMYEGYGLIPVDYGKLLKYRPAVRLSNGPYVLPANVRGEREPGGFSVDGLFMGTVEMEVAEFESYLRALLAQPR